MPASIERDYILGTHDEELERLGLQHRVWRSSVLDCWRRAGIASGSRVLDVGAGPGYATVDLAEIVGSTGQVISVERSKRFVDAAAALCRSRGLENVRLHELDLMNDPLPAENMDAAWCRWVACFVFSPDVLVSKLAKAIKPGGVVIFHEFIDYSTWRLATFSPALEEFVQKVMQSWRDSGGEPDIARTLPSLLSGAGFKLVSAVPKIFCLHPCDEMWQWPTSFIEVNLKRLLELGRADEQWAASVRLEFEAATANSESLMLTPVLLEIIAERIEN